MKNFILVLIFLLLISQHTFAQKADLSVAVNSGWFSYSGPGAAATTYLNTNTVSGQEFNYTNNPYGRGFTLSYGISLNSKYIFNSSLLAGFDLGFERLNAKTKSFVFLM